MDELWAVASGRASSTHVRVTEEDGAEGGAHKRDDEGGLMAVHALLRAHGGLDAGGAAFGGGVADAQLCFTRFQLVLSVLERVLELARSVLDAERTPTGESV